MIDFAELLQWDRYITPSVIRVFYWLCLAMVVMTGLSLILTALGMMAVNFLAGLLLLIAAMIFILAGIVFVRIACELVMVIFRINEHLGAIREQGVEVGAFAAPGQPRQRRT
ncbi:DUF4282 domain-containing protein [Pseudorhodoplanes sp.]|uniref:DUF4282 domain-containing protein n=1 Tax=Pseudorhodoplanes sp. TaxID=1934341 RepID=UPI002C19B1CF|nr:DUF4282 domain-containing protein [Pseudorhodoplanes sp.]HWV51903.1 DUF4282 domain-containing protein [Pseudorhodoplanes sp.]